MKMNYYAENKLTSKELSVLDKLSGSCSYVPFYVPEITGYYHHFHFIKENDEILSFLGIMPVSENTVEITALTHPSVRHHGYFTFLLKNVMFELSAFRIGNILSDRKLDFPFLQNSYSHSEYLMQLPFSTDFLFHPEIMEYTSESDNQQNYLYLITDCEKTAGFLRITRDTGSSSACLHHVFIRKSFRGLGYGKRLLTGALALFFQKNSCDILLHVTSTNTAAVHLYQESGFHIAESLDYFTLRIPEEPVHQ